MQNSLQSLRQYEEEGLEPPEEWRHRMQHFPLLQDSLNVRYRLGQESVSPAQRQSFRCIHDISMHKHV